MTVAAGPTLTAVDLLYLEAALELALSPGPAVEPDPFVGALVVTSDGAVVGRGCHQTYGGAHAEPIALADARGLARGATLYCTLEPCGYLAPEKRQPACTSAIIEAGVARVVIGALDPHPRVSGAGMRALLTAGLDVAAAAQERYLAASRSYLETLDRR